MTIVLVYLVRHPESLANARLTDDLDTALSPLGVQQTAALVRRLAACRLTAIYSSPFQRCLDTAEAVAERVGLAVHLRPELCEFHSSPKDSRLEFPLRDVRLICSERARVKPCPDHVGPFVWPSLHESLDSLIARTRRFVNYLKFRWIREEDAVLVVSHGSPIARLIDAWLSESPGPSFRFILDNAALSVVRYHAQVSSLVCLNEMSHLADLPPPAASNFLSDGTVRAVPVTNYW